MHRNLLIFTDLDGTLLDYHTYSKDAALPALDELKKHDIPLVIVSSKTRAEIEPMLDLPNMSQVFIVENGSAIFFRRGIGMDLGKGAKAFGDYDAVILGERYGRVIEVMRQAQQECGVKVCGFSDMSAAEVAEATGLDMASASRAKQREFSEPFLFEGEQQRLKNFIGVLQGYGLTCTQGGRFCHVLGRCDKGRAIKKAVKIYEKNNPGTAWKTICLGDSENDTSMLKTADVALIIKRHDGSFMDYMPRKNQEVQCPAGIGPAGWNEAVLNLVRKEFSSV